MFTKGRFIWLAIGSTDDQYAEFTDALPYTEGDIAIHLTCDSDYTLYVNDRYVASGQYGDYAHYKIYDTIDLTPHLVQGENTLRILVHHWGVPSSRYTPAAAGLLYEVHCKGEILAYSRPETRSRLSPAYRSGSCKTITSQLGLSFTYDATKEGDCTDFAPSVLVSKPCTFYPRPIPKHKVLPRHPMASVRCLAPNHYLVDLGGEVVGLPSLSLTSCCAQPITVCFGEHILDGGVRRRIKARDFSFTYIAREGDNQFTNYMLRIGCRYLELLADAPFALQYAGVLPQVYEIAEVPCNIQDPFWEQIYAMCVRTLRLCMMEHYVDCPWREQALYTFDSRNQMRFGYLVFADGNANYARANLALIGQDRRADGLLSICYPCDPNHVVIPAFSLHYILQMKEYIDYTGDTTLSEEYLPKLTEILRAFLPHIQDGLLYKPHGEKMWNFYDWSPHSAGVLGDAEAYRPDLALGCLYILALDALAAICRRLGCPLPTDLLLADSLRTALHAAFLTEDGLFTMHREAKEHTALCNALAILAGVATKAEAERICVAITEGALVPCSLSVKLFVYEALLDTDTPRWRDWVLAQLRADYAPMMEAGSDTVWETALGAEDFHGAGSLCHGWSAVPVYILHRLGIAKRSDHV